MKTKTINNIIQVIQYAGEKLTAFNIDDIKLVGYALGFSYDKDKYRRSLLSLQKTGLSTPLINTVNLAGQMHPLEISQPDNFGGFRNDVHDSRRSTKSSWLNRGKNKIRLPNESSSECS